MSAPRQSRGTDSAVMRAHRICMLLHRWTGLAIALFLLIAGLTGAVLAYYNPLDRWLNPELYFVRGSGAPLSPFQLREAAERSVVHAQADYVTLDRPPGEAAVVSLTGAVDPVSGSRYELPFDEVFIDPYTGRQLGHRTWGRFAPDRAHALPFLYQLHYTLALPEPWGRWLLGVAALAWVINCLLGFYLTLPLQPRNFLRRWKPSWQVRAWRPAWRFSFDLHRAAGLWTWAMLLVFSVSAVQLNLTDEVFNPVLRALLPVSEAAPSPSPTSVPTATTPVGWESARELGARYMAVRARREGFQVLNETGLFFDRSTRSYEYSVNSTLDTRTGGGETALWLSASDGRELAFESPHAAPGNLVASWLDTLHTARTGGPAYVLLVFLIGIVVAALALTGFIVWLKRHGTAT